MGVRCCGVAVCSSVDCGYDYADDYAHALRRQEDMKQYHIALDENDAAEYCILPGDPVFLPP